jgi:hypothetical protein
MTRRQFVIAFILCLTLTVAAGAIHGRVSGRWGASDKAKQAAALLESLPNQFGDWVLEKNDPLDSTSVSQLQPYAYVNRVYGSQTTGQKVSFFVLLGPTGPTAVHTPGVCYSSRNYTITQPSEKTVLREDSLGTDQMWSMTFRANSLDGGLLRVYYGWSAGLRWEASSGTRYEFAGLPYLYKIQLAADLPRDANLETDDTCRLFLKDLLPVLRKKMIPAAQ